MTAKRPLTLAEFARRGGQARGPSKRRSTSFTSERNPKVAATHAVELTDGSFLELHVQAYVVGYYGTGPVPIDFGFADYVVVRSSSPAATNWLRRRGWVRTMRPIGKHGRMVSTWSQR